MAARCCCPGEMSVPQHQAGRGAERCRSRPSCTGWGTKWEAVRELWGLGLPSGGNTVRLSFLGGAGVEEERRSFDVGEQRALEGNTGSDTGSDTSSDTGSLP